MFVLFGFVTWAMSVQNWKLWPSTSFRLPQPLSGLVQIVILAFPALGLYLVFGLPALSATTTAALMPLDTVLGWFYSVVVSITLTGQTMDNWPWHQIGGGRPGRVAAASSIGNLVLGTGLYFAMTGLLHVLLGQQTVSELGASFAQFPAQLGVCWVFWMILWATAFGNRPTALPAAGNLVARAALTFTLGLGTFALYYSFAADQILHEPAVATGLHGDALGFIDLAVLWTFFYVLGFDSYGLRRPVPGPANNLQDPPALVPITSSPIRKFMK
ncbi:hypothetical protein ACIPWF_18355 [Paenarthrobacter sp. NPDC089989]|uniref:hypothetical protein n=1 Tax=unclassified Paenarthrobacter TaxID=2634190 RepID=UPI00380C5432